MEKIDKYYFEKALSLCRENYLSGKLDKAKVLALELTSKFPDQQSAWKMLGAVFAQEGQHSEALDAWRMVVNLSPDDAAARYNLGVALQSAGSFEEAQ